LVDQMKGSRTLGALLAMLGILAGAPAAQAAVAHLDHGFGPGGIAYLPSETESSAGIALAGDGRIVVGGHRTVTALLPTGRLDPSFGTEGVATIAAPSAGFEAIAVDPSGRPVAVGAARSDSLPDTEPFIERFTPAGAPDASFGAGAGYLLADLGLPPPRAGARATASLQEVAFDPTGRIVVRGTRASGRGSGDFLARLEESGAPDPSFGKAGVRTLPEVTHWYDENRLLKSWAFGPGGQISVGIKDGDASSVLRMHEDGSRDRSFGQGGTAPYPPGTTIGPLVDRRGRTITSARLQGVEHLLPNGILIRRLRPDGAPDRGFGEHGSDKLRIPHLYEYKLALDAEGRILIAASLKGRSWIAEGKDLALLRLRPDGRIDEAFGHGGMVRIPFPYAPYPLVDLEGIDVRGGKAAILADDCDHGCRPAVALVDLGRRGMRGRSSADP
jgi:uncharacterized delta-60 repeat protein